MSRLSYPFRNLPPARGFDRGTFSQAFMDKTFAVLESLKAKSPNGRRLKLDAIQLRVAIFAIRANVEYARRARRLERLRKRRNRAFLQLMGKAWLSLMDRGSLHIDDKSIAQLKGKSHHVIHSLERHMKRANRALIAAIGKKQYSALTIAWKAHLRWMRLHIAYCKPWGKPLPGLRKRQQQDLDVLMEMTRRGLRNTRHQQPSDKDLRHVIRLYAKYARQGLQGNMTVHFLVENKKGSQNTYHLAHFVIDHLDLKELSKP